jgi:DNA repair protein RecO (recombination protein O)
MAIHKSEGIILSTADWSESSQMLTMFTPDRGKMTLSVRGARRLVGKRGRPLRFARLEFTCYIRENSETGTMSEVEPVEVFLFEKDGQLGRLTFGSAAVELLNNLLEPLEPQASCYQITLSFLRMTDRLPKKQLPGLFAGYILRLVSLLGFRPNMVGCVGCGAEIEMPSDTSDTNATPILVSIERGGVICHRCRQEIGGQNNLVGLSTTVFDKINHLMVSSLEESSQVPVTLNELNRMMEMLTALLKFHAGTIRQLKSFDFLDKLARAVQTYGG